MTHSARQRNVGAEESKTANAQKHSFAPIPLPVSAMFAVRAFQAPEVSVSLVALSFFRVFCVFRGHIFYDQYFDWCRA